MRAAINALPVTSGVPIAPRCQQMFDSGEDWDAFRHLGAQDTMAWPGDPCRALNEPTDLVGNFLR